MRLKMTGKHYNADLVKDFLLDIEKEATKLGIEISNVNVYVAFKDENGNPCDIAREGKSLNYKTVFEKGESGEKETILKEWLI
jgi:hypothetical protein